MINISKNYIKYLAIVISGLAGILILFSNLYYCEFTGDENYMALCVRDYRSSPLGLLTFALGHLWCDIFGFNLLSLRILTRIIYIISIGGAIIFMSRRVKSTALICLTILTSSFIASLGGFGIYDWNTGSYPFVVFTVIALLTYTTSPSTLRIAIAGIFCGLLTMSKVPMGFMAFIALSSIIYIHKESYNATRKMIVDASVGLIAMIITIIITILIICGSYSGALETFNPGNIINGHGFDSIPNFIWRFKLIFPFIFMSWGAGFLSYWLAEKTTCCSLLSIKGIGALILAVVTGWCTLRMIALQFDYSIPVFGLGFPYILILSFIYPFFILDIPGKAKFKSAIIFASVLIMGIGSDSFPERWHGSFLLPIALGIIYSPLNLMQKENIVRWFSISIIMFVCMLLYRNFAIRNEYIKIDHIIPTRGDVPVPLDFEEYRSSIEPEVNKLRASRSRFTFWGPFQQALSLAYEPVPAFSIHTFHYAGLNILDYTKDPSQLDYIFVTYADKDPSLVENTIEALENNGFSRVKTDDHYILYKNLHINSL